MGLGVPKEGEYLAIYVPNPSSGVDPYMIPLRIYRVRNKGFEKIDYGSIGEIDGKSYILTKFPLDNPDIPYIPPNLRETILYNDDENRVVWARIDIRPRHLLKLQLQAPRPNESYYVIENITITPENAESIGTGYTESPMEIAVLPKMDFYLAVMNFSNVKLKTYAKIMMADLEVRGIKDPVEIAKILTNNTNVYVNIVVFPGTTEPGPLSLEACSEKIEDFITIPYTKLKLTSNVKQLSEQIQQIISYGVI